jgi:hypothetical protein
MVIAPPKFPRKLDILRLVLVVRKPWLGEIIM